MIRQMWLMLVCVTHENAGLNGFFLYLLSCCLFSVSLLDLNSEQKNLLNRKCKQKMNNNREEAEKSDKNANKKKRRE